jgi:DNA-binding protein HU-beta
VNKAELIEALAAEYDGSKAQAAKALNAVIDTITYSTARGEKVSITGFGVFEKIRRPARMVRNPRTGERKRAKATSVPKFRAGSELKAYVSGEKKPPRATAKKATAKTAATKTSATRTAAKSAPAKTAAPAKKATPAKKTTPAKKAPAKKTVATKAPAKKTAAKKAPAKRTAKKA